MCGNHIPHSDKPVLVLCWGGNDIWSRTIKFMQSVAIFLHHFRNKGNLWVKFLWCDWQFPTRSGTIPWFHHQSMRCKLHHNHIQGVQLSECLEHYCVWCHNMEMILHNKVWNNPTINRWDVHYVTTTSRCLTTSLSMTSCLKLCKKESQQEVTWLLIDFSST